MDAFPELGSSFIVIAIVIPSVVLIALVTLIIIVLALSGTVRNDGITLKQERVSKRKEELERNVKTHKFDDWLMGQKEKHPGFLTTDSICAICLDGLTGNAQIRGLQCSHAFHKQCLDEYYCAFVYEYCPLCHRTIIPGASPASQKKGETSDSITEVVVV
ncbi:hypothetical protein P153DRAFT_343349 [Dothidotthia symphoricarpi CBS 119687]|uniref:RING-type domain-containing protein n=1 Tax=Dothidotthia symphoricarpi CBS 119687 TaxID=1392245 RepID=A0A6A6A8H8_9PLEO|nr:uncharacterized protein P153DRAFT_343349 [Dothidotthia symphoricarpi CBS 119687]KAF2128150.1 hypothetical protein P153DRAFT_343349 [Dothidotthia symphoricarpi CBS 119687]